MKKGSIADLFTIAIIMLIFSFIIITTAYIWDKIKAPISSMLPSSRINEITTGVSNSLSLFDIMFGFFQIGLMIFVVFSVFYLDTNPVYFFIAIFLLVISIILSGQFSTMFTRFIQTSDINETTAVNYTIITWIMDNQPLIIAITGMLMLIFLYAKARGMEG